MNQMGKKGPHQLAYTLFNMNCTYTDIHTMRRAQKIFFFNLSAMHIHNDVSLCILTIVQLYFFMQMRNNAAYTQNLWCKRNW